MVFYGYSAHGIESNSSSKPSAVFLLYILLVGLIRFLAPVKTYASSESPSPASWRPPPRPSGQGCYTYTIAEGWQSSHCASPEWVAANVPHPMEGGFWGVDGARASSAVIAQGDVEVQTPTFSGESDSQFGSGAYSIQVNTNEHTGYSGHLYWWQFTYQNEPSRNTGIVCIWWIDLSAKPAQYNSSCMFTPLQPLSTSYDSNMEGYLTTDQYGNPMLGADYCNNNSYYCASPSPAYDNFGLTGHWYQTSGTILGAGNGSIASFTSPTNEWTFLSQYTHTSASCTDESDTLTGEMNNLYYRSESQCSSVNPAVNTNSGN